MWKTDTELAHSEDELQAAIALQLMEGIGPVLARRLVEHCGGFAAVFREKRQSLRKIDRVGEQVIAYLNSKQAFVRAEAELKFLQEKRIKALVFSDARYPTRLRQCNDAPIVIFVRGEAELNPIRVLSVVGTRHISAYGELMCKNLIQGLSGLDVTIVSGMAYGVDIVAHRAALQCGLPTLACLAHGLDRLYPSHHIQTGREMLEKTGAWISEFESGVKPDRENFPRRNRIIAGISDATLVIESGNRGGSMITASLAFGYSREVLAVPGRVGDPQSAGCLSLIREQKAALVETPEHIIQLLGWTGDAFRPAQLQLFNDLGEEETLILDLLKLDDLHVDILSLRCGIPGHRLAGILLELELKGYIRTLPGKVYGRSAS